MHNYDEVVVCKATDILHVSGCHTGTQGQQGSIFVGREGLPRQGWWLRPKQMLEGSSHALLWGGDPFTAPSSALFSRPSPSIFLSFLLWGAPSGTVYIVGILTQSCAFSGGCSSHPRPKTTYLWSQKVWATGTLFHLSGFHVWLIMVESGKGAAHHVGPHGQSSGCAA